MNKIATENLLKNYLINEINNLEDHEFFELIGKFFLADVEIGKTLLIHIIKELN